MKLKRYDGFVINETDTKGQILAAARIKVEELQAAETEPNTAWYINILHPTKRYAAVIVSDAIKNDYPTIASNIDLFNGEELADDLKTINDRIDALVISFANINTQITTDSSRITTADNKAIGANTKADEAKTLATNANSLANAAKTAADLINGSITNVQTLANTAKTTADQALALAQANQSSGGSNSSSAGYSDKMLGFVQGVVTKQTFTNSKPFEVNANLSKCVIGTKIYFVSKNIDNTSDVIKLFVYNTVSRTWSIINTGIVSDAMPNTISITADVAGNKIYILTPFNSVEYTPDSPIEATYSKIYKYQIANNTTSLLTSLHTPVLDATIHFLYGNLHISNCQTVAYDENEMIFIPSTYLNRYTYNISGNSWSTSTMSKGPVNYTVKYPGSFSTEFYEYSEINQDYLGPTMDIYKWYIGSSTASKILSYNKYEMGFNTPNGIAAGDIYNSTIIAKHIRKPGIQYLLINILDYFEEVRLVLPNSTLTEFTNITIVGTNLYIMDESVANEVQVVDLTQLTDPANYHTYM